MPRSAHGKGRTKSQAPNPKLQRTPKRQLPALQNAVKHGSAHKVSVDLTGGPKGLTLAIVDDGVGFDVDALSAKGLGLVSMQERLEPLGGTLEIHSRPGAGTRLNAFVPAPPPASAVASTP